MTNFFQIISAKITTFITVVIITITSILPRSATNKNKPVDTSTATSSATISKSLFPSISVTPTPDPKAQNKAENKPTIEPTPVPISFPTLASQTTSNISPTSNSNIQPKTYSIVPISVMNIGSMESHLQIIAQNAYQEFLRTSNLNRLDESNQIEILVGIYTRMLREEIATTQQNISQLKQENTPTPSPVAIYINSEIETKLAELRQTLEHIRNQTVPMAVIEGRTQQAYQDWIRNNSAVHSAILGSRYINDLNAILRAYGL